MTGQKISIAQLRPTQMTLGLDEVASRAAKIAAMGPADLEALLKKKPIPYVLVQESRSTSSTIITWRARSGL